MYSQKEKSQQNKNKAAANSAAQKKKSTEQCSNITDNRTKSPVQTRPIQSNSGQDVLQRAEVGDPAKLAEEQYAIVDTGKSIVYTALAAGCLAVTVKFQGGGGAGVHMAMMEQGAGQWTSFFALISKKAIAEAHLDCDGWGGDEGWRVNKKSDSPQSTLGLILGGLVSDKKDLPGLGWSADLKDILDWFEAKLGVRPAHHVNQNPQYTMS